MSEVSRLKRVWRAAWIISAMATLASCASDPDGYGPPDPTSIHNPSGGNPTQTKGEACVGPQCACEASPKPGCPCSVEGEHLICGARIDAMYPDGQGTCGQGISVCTNGTFGDCVINNAVTIVPSPPAGYHTENLGSATNCTTNPCDPSCSTYVDDPNGLTNKDAGISGTPSGVTLIGDGGSVCVPKTCADLGKNCGPVSDTCGGLLNCGSCTSPAKCGGNGVPSVCAIPPNCTNLCLQQTVCPNNGTTSISGKVYAPNGVTPLPNAIVYVPNAAVQPFAAGVTCVTSSNCTESSGAPLVSTTTDVNGSFTLTNMPVGSNIPVVIQIGRFRRQITIPTVTACANKDTSHLSTSGTCKANGSTCAANSDCCSLSCSKTNGANPKCDPLTRLPKNKAEGDIPKMAFVTGDVDGLECVWRKIGIDDSEFTNPSGSGRINFYQGGWEPGAYISGPGTWPAFTTYEAFAGTAVTTGTPWEDALIGSPTELAKFDIVLFPCQGAQFYWDKQTQFETNIANYVNAGGRVFTTHYSYIYIYGDSVDSGAACKKDGTSCSSSGQCCSLSCNGSGKCQSIYSSPLQGAVQWAINQSNPTPDPQNGIINQSFPKGATLAQWLFNVGASTTLGQMSINTLRHDFNGVVAPTTLWVSLGSGVPMEATFNTPLGQPAANQCGRVVHSDFHVESSADTNVKFPGECPGGAMTPQEVLLENMLFDLAGCVTPDTPPACVPQTCSAQGLNCGMAGDGCGNTINCGSCTSPQTCGGGGMPGVCGTPFTYSDAYFVRDYDATGVCPEGFGPMWRLYSWSATTPGDSSIAFTVSTATTAAGLASAPLDTMVFSNPPGPVALLNQPAVAHAAGVPLGSPDTEIGAASPDYTLQQNNRVQNNAFLRVSAHLVPSSDHLKAPTLVSWNMQIDCVAIQ